MALSGIMNKVHFANKVPLLMKATSADSTLPAGHIYDEITRITYDSLEQGDVLVEFLTDRLKKNSPYTKLKVLLIMKTVILKGHEEFRHSLSKQAQGIREARSFNGPPDALHGDAPYVNVREAAGQLLQILFDTDRSNHGNQANVSADQNVTKMEGFGNSMPEKPSASSTVNSVLQRVADNMSYAFTQNLDSVAKYSNNAAPGNVAGNYQPFNGRKEKFISKPSNAFLITSSSQAMHQNQDNEDSYTPARSDFSDWRDKLQAAEPQRGEMQANTDNVAETVTKLDWSQEVRLVNDITVAGGVKLNPARSELENFIKRCEQLDFQKIMDLINEKLRNENYKVQMRALFVVESTLNSRIPNAFQLIIETLLESIERLSLSSQTAVKNKATKLLLLMKPRPSKSYQDQPSVVTKNDVTKSPSGDLLSLADGPSSQVSQDCSGVKSNGDSNNTDLFGSIFDGLSLQNDPIQQQMETVSQSSSKLPSAASSASEVTSVNQHDLLLQNAPYKSVSQTSDARTTFPNSTTDTSSIPSLLDLDPFTFSAGSVNKSNHNIEQQSNLMPSGISQNVLESKELTSSQVDPFASLDPYGSSKNDTTTLMQDARASTQVGLLANAVSTNLAPQNTSDALKPSGQSGQERPSGQVHASFFPVSSYPTSTELQQSTPVYNNQSVYNPMPSSIIYPNQSANLTHQGQARVVVSSMPSSDKSSEVNRKLSSYLPNNSQLKSSNGFEFLSTKKPGAFDFVKEAMQASKRK